MPRTVKVTLHEPYLKTLETWASVRRTLEAARTCCDRLLEWETNHMDVDRAILARDELDQIIPMLEHLHLQVREQLWMPIVWPYDGVNKRWAIVVQEQKDKVFWTDGASYILGDIESFGSPILDTMKFKLGEREVMLVSISGDARVRWVVTRGTFEGSDREAIKHFQLS